MSDKMIQLPLPFEESMSTFDAVMIAEGVQPVETEEEYLEAWQMLIDTGMAYQLQGWFGRTANQLIEAGRCTAPTTNNEPYSC
jgi:hypothetical protein